MNNMIKTTIGLALFIVAANSFAAEVIANGHVLGSCTKQPQWFACCKVDNDHSNDRWMPYSGATYEGGRGSLKSIAAVCSEQSTPGIRSYTPGDSCTNNTLVPLNTYHTDVNNGKRDLTRFLSYDFSSMPTLDGYCTSHNNNTPIYDASIPTAHIIKICTRWTGKENAPTGKTTHNLPYRNTYDSIVATISAPEYIKPGQEEKDNSKTLKSADELVKVKDPSVTITLPSPNSAWNCQEYSYDKATRPSFSEFALTMTGKVRNYGTDGCGETTSEGICMPVTSDHTEKFSAKFNYSMSDYLKGCSINIDWVPSNETSTIATNKVRKLKGDMTDKDICE